MTRCGAFFQRTLLTLKINIFIFQLKTAFQLKKKISIHPVQFSRYERGQSVPKGGSKNSRCPGGFNRSDRVVYGDQDNKAEQSISDRELLSMFKKVQLLSEREKETVKDFLSSYILKNDLKQKLA